MKCMPNHWSSVAGLAVALAFAGFLWAGSAQAHGPDHTGAHQEFDTEHIFGFTEGADIGEKGEKEVESGTVFRFGKPGDFLAIDHETAFRYMLTDDFRASLGGLLTYRYDRGVPGEPDSDRFDFAGLTAQMRWHAVQPTRNSPFGLTLSFTPIWERVEANSAVNADTYVAAAEILADAEWIPNKLFSAINIEYEPGVTNVNGFWRHENGLEFRIATAYALSRDVLIGGEVRHASGGERSLFEAEALFAGPSLWYRISDTSSIKVSWSFQIPDESTHNLDLVNFERNQALILLVKTF